MSTRLGYGVRDSTSGAQVPLLSSPRASTKDMQPDASPSPPDDFLLAAIGSELPLLHNAPPHQHTHSQSHGTTGKTYGSVASDYVAKQWARRRVVSVSNLMQYEAPWSGWIDRLSRKQRIFLASSLITATCIGIAFALLFPEDICRTNLREPRVSFIMGVILNITLLMLLAKFIYNYSVLGIHPPGAFTWIFVFIIHVINTNVAYLKRKVEFGDDTCGGQPLKVLVLVDEYLSALKIFLLVCFYTRNDITTPQIRYAFQAVSLCLILLPEIYLTSQMDDIFPSELAPDDIIQVDAFVTSQQSMMSSGIALFIVGFFLRESLKSNHLARKWRNVLYALGLIFISFGELGFYIDEGGSSYLTTYLSMEIAGVVLFFSGKSVETMHYDSGNCFNIHINSFHPE
eukprot:TRINITY_DN3010_c0_g1_i9.p1 TRINITY_DN3010_c0_g1~~TRINITY_DN3010_c0_g1_i9.p1  ORF type:complete len:400 (-),score=61.22 TRINITY_DN3010_c0_g1_i9:753-1952(-)